MHKQRFYFFQFRQNSNELKEEKTYITQVAVFRIYATCLVGLELFKVFSDTKTCSEVVTSDESNWNAGIRTDFKASPIERSS